jgi:hypothetical protein
MHDPQIHGTIEQPVAEEHELWQRDSAGGYRGRTDAPAGAEDLA